ncbi:uncharacterized protein BP5553_04850 [Venustampulla echinocandica]|uniref:Protein AF-9 homolog n=1 Tax=Venustampulla echinocandica TaxID=2656787 RepID=A0A370TPG4_9HELO|nr:uncharacterized protein BP5553_04850 [Venustampulla echinocandica]RDL37417.1 hypothetical protein BP5553_04850 [Venustampulla echinocandica]
MAPPNNQKRVKGVQIFRPFVYGSTAKLFDPATNPKPPGTPEDHTHSWTVFVKGVDDTDITYWCKKVQFKLHDSIPNPLRCTDFPSYLLPAKGIYWKKQANIPILAIEAGAPGTPFQVHETGWGEFEIAIKLYYIPESLEKPQTLYHHLRLHPYGNTETEKETMRQAPQIISWAYEEQLFNEPYEQFYDLLTSPVDRSKGAGGKGTKMMKGGMVGSSGERTSLIPLSCRPGQPFSRETEKAELKRLREAQGKVEEMTKKLQSELRDTEKELASLKEG